MRQSDIKEGETYLFVATDVPQRKHLEGKPFTVVEKRAVYRRFTGQRGGFKNRYFNTDNVGARAEELEPMPAQLAGTVQCPHCQQISLIDEIEADKKCPECGELVDLPAPPPADDQLLF